MKHYNSLVAAIPALLFAGAFLSADSLTVQLTGVGPSDGSYSVLPYQLSVDGAETAAICYDFLHEISMNQTWSANELTLAEAQSGGQFSGLNNAVTGYEQVAWLSSLWFTQTLNAGDQVDLQHAIWDVFDPGAYILPSDPFLTGVAAAETSGIAGLDFDSYRFLEAISLDGTLAQSFVLYVPGGNNENPGGTPEPASVFLLTAGMSLIGMSKLRQVTRRH